MSLSVWCPTRDPGPRLRAILGMFRPVADEIVVAVDSRVDPALLGHHAAVADRLVRFEYAPPLERVSAWLTTLCTSDWLLRIDGDEVPSAALVAALPSLVAATDVHQYEIRCRWLFPDVGTYLDEPPWNYTAIRLVRSDPATFWHDGRLHGGPARAFPSRLLVDEAFYHLDSLVTDRTAREAKLRGRYLATPDHLKPYGSDRDSTLYYLPETADSIRLTPVPSEDRAAIEHVLAATGAELPTPPGVDVPLHTRAEIDAHWAGRTPPGEAYRAELSVLDRDLRFSPGEHRPMRIRLTNRGTDHWPGGRRPPFVRAGYRLFSRDGTQLIDEAHRTDLPGPVGSGHTVVVPLVVAAPEEPGAYRLEIDLVHEHVRWFEQPVTAVITVG